MKIRIGSRKSDLAQIQSRIVAAALKKVQPDLDFEFVFKDVGVDLNLNISLVEAESKGLFTKDLSQDLIQEKIDIVVHSWKDLPTTGPAETVVAATLEREDPRDLIFIKKDSVEKKSLVFLSSSPRRGYNIGNFLKNYVFSKSELQFISVRGNLPTRMKKYLKGEGDALILALAAVKRLNAHGSEESKAVLKEVLLRSKLLVVPVMENPPAPAQGALAIEVKKNRKDLLTLLEKINHKISFSDVIAERERLKDFGGGCHLKLGIYQRTLERGVLVVESGEDPAGKELKLKEWKSERAVPKFPKEKFFEACKLKIFDRKALAFPENLKTNNYLYLVSKSDALPENIVKEKDELWVAGLDTWKKLREKGYWISGSYEGLGEKFLAVPTELWPELKVLKLSHKDAPQTAADFCATYELVRNDQKIPDLSSYEIFFWTSGSLFLACLHEQPALKDKVHVCGLGNTYDELKKHLPEERLFSVLSRDHLPGY